MPTPALIKEATVAFRNPKRDSTFILQMDNPSRAPGAANEVEIRIGDQSLGTVPVSPDEAPVRKFALTAAECRCSVGSSVSKKTA